MAYLRWSCSEWYVFWHASNAKKADDELLAIWYAGAKNLPILSFKELKKIETIEDLKNIMKKFLTEKEFKKINEFDWEELFLAIKWWKRDIKKKYSEKF